MYRNNQEFLDSQKKRVKELVIFLDDKKSCVVNDDENGKLSIEELRTLYPDKVVRVEKGGEK